MNIGEKKLVGIDEHKITYERDEREIFWKLHVPIMFPLRVFSIEGLGMDPETFFCDLRPTFAHLLWDQYDVRRERALFLYDCYPAPPSRLRYFILEYYNGAVHDDEIENLVAGLPPDQEQRFRNICPYRKRAAAKFIVAPAHKKNLEIQRLQLGAFTQHVAGGDIRAIKRVFPEMAEEVTSNLQFQMLLLRIWQIIRGIYRKRKTIQITAHQVSVYARFGKFGNNAPEGIHQDGVPFIVSALVVERKGVNGGESAIYAEDKQTLYLRKTLLPGEGIFQADTGSPFWHDVSPIFLNEPSDTGVRSIFGFDIQVL